MTATQESYLQPMGLGMAVSGGTENSAGACLRVVAVGARHRAGHGRDLPFGKVRDCAGCVPWCDDRRL